ncbi:hypothetical protein E1B28_012158 [Marasmius oreades]|uniref:Trafficking protein particle complex II-specific subunit 65 IgD3 domain-containing protein n=1 Tax=Marasmius oreades TaxID=181124 RepID=A0A9P7RQW5_9AGAR|nr:uncharacterized protein E1B28_012158 [Marasmius oreades]KAG7088136.1 hypothetical protein E1B28_012158 [Marasmius oreades]
MALNLSPNPSPKVPPQSVHPPILPPATPIPTPASAETDRRYAQSEGVMLCTRIWGAEGPSTLGDEGDEATENPDSKQETVEMTRNQAKPQEDFHLIWSERENVWVAAYKIVFTVAYLRLPFRLPAGVSPLLCITLSTTLRDLPVAVNGPKNPLARYISTIGGNRLTVPSSSPIVPSAPNLSSQPEVSAPKGGLGEVNLLGALFSVPSALQSPVSPSSTPVINPPESQLVLPSTRLGSSMRSSLFFLPSTPAGLPPSPLYSPMQTPGGGLKPASHPTLRKSFRKTLFATSGFKVRMRTVFVPSLTIDAEQDEGYLSGDGVERNDGKNRSEEGDKEEQDEPSSGSEEGTVVLCVEIENEQDHFSKSSDYGGRNAGGFLVERVEVSIGGGESEGASAHLIGWGADALLSLKRKKATVDNNFPLLLTPREQFNLLYAVTFLRSPEEVDYMSTLSIEGRSAGLKLGNKALAQAAGGKDMLQRSVTLKIFGRPSYVSPSETETSFYPTSTFCTRWNCILDLSTTSLIDRRAEDDSMESTPTANPNRPFSTSAPSVLPEPASPFPASITSPRLPPSNVGPLIAGDARRASFGTLSKSGTSSRSSTPAYASSIADSRRHTVAGAGITSGAAGLIKAATAGARNSFAPGMSSPPLPERRDGFPGVPPQRERRDSGPRSSPLSYTPPSTVLQTQIPRSPTTYEAPPLPPFKDRAGNLTVSVPGPSLDQVMMGHMPPVTPAYPAYPTHASPNQSPLPPTPNLGPYIPQGGANVSPGYGSYSGPSVEVPRDKGLMMGSSPGYSPQTPTPHVGFGNGGAPPGIFDGGGGVGLNMSRLGGGVADPIVVSIGLIHKGKSTETGKIHPSDRFALNIFVFNKSSWTRRFDVSCPDPRMLRKNEERLGSLRKSFESGRATALPGVVPLENRVRIGPLHPSACQSVGIEFLALAPGVHSIDTLTLTDVETGFSMNLRSVMDIVVHENYDDMS